MRKFIAVFLAIALFAGFGMTVLADENTPKFEVITSDADFDTTGATKYHFVAERDDGTMFFFTTGSVGSSAPYSCACTDDIAAKNIMPMGILKVEEGVYRTQYDAGGDAGVYIGPSGAGKSGATDAEGNVKDIYRFNWNNELGCFYRNVNGVDTCLALAFNGTEWRFMAIPMSTLANGEMFNGEKVYPVRPAVQHVCTGGEEWKNDDNAHWYECACGGQVDYAFHSATKWTTTKEPAIGVEGEKKGTCECGYEVTARIPALREETKEDPTEGTKAPAADKNDGSNTPAPAPMDTTTIILIGFIVLIVLIVVVIGLGVAMLIVGTKKAKKED